jgi:membrane fusion protein (multidrug efflux system)
MKFAAKLTERIPAKKAAVFLIIIAVIIGAGVYYYVHRNEVSTDDAAIDGRTVVISAKVPGYVKALYVQDNQKVRVGDVLLEIDPADYIIRRNRAKAVLAAAIAAADASRSNLETTAVSAPSSIDAAKAQLASAEASWTRSSGDRRRMEFLFSSGAISRQELDLAIATERSDYFTLDKLRADIRSANTAPSVIAAVKNTSEQLQALSKQAEADLAQAESDLANTRVLAPLDGHITKRSVETGNYVQTGQQLSSLVGSELWVVANFKENQLERMRPGQPVDIRIDAFPHIRLRGRVDSMQLGTGARFSLFPAENATGNFVKIVQRIPVKIVFDSPPDDSLLLGLGMSVIPTVFTEATGPKK